MSADLLIDTHVALWFVRGEQSALELLEDALDDPSSTVTFSVVSLYEIAIKHSIRRLVERPEDVRRALVEGAGMLELGLSHNHASAYTDLPLRHKDPFDRMLLAQARAEEMTFVTADRHLAPYRDIVDLRGV